MACLSTLVAAHMLVGAATSNPACNTEAGLAFAPQADQPPEAGLLGAQISVLTYNVRGLPWPLATGRAKALKKIGSELAEMRREGRQPDVVLLQEGFRSEVGDLVRTSGYRYWASGPSRFERAEAPLDPGGFSPVRYVLAGEGWGKFTNGGLHVLSDLPIVRVRTAPYRYCAGLDCLANKGVLLVSVALPGAPAQVDIVNTHLNSKGAAKVPRSRSLKAHNLQTEQLIAFINDQRTVDAPLLVGGDFNVRNAPERYNHLAPARPYRVVSEFCSQPASPCGGQASSGEASPWLRSQDLQAFSSAGQVNVQPVKIEKVFHSAFAGQSLSDHDGYLVRYQLNWEAAALEAKPVKSVEVKPQFGTWGVKVAWRR